MIQLVPSVVWLALLTSAVLLILLWADDLGPRSRRVLPAWFLIAAYLQVFGGSAGAAAGLALQTLLAVYLIVRWRLAE